MKKIFVIASLLVGFVCTAQIKPAAIGVTYGVKTTAKGAIEVPVLEEKLVTAAKFTGKIKGTIQEVCTTKGCWMKLATTEGDGIMVRFKDYKFFMPLDIVGKEVVLDGVAKVTTTSVEDLKHYAEDGGKSKEEIEKTEKKRLFDDNMLESLEELLISADMGVDTSLRVSANMADGNLGKKVSVNEVKILLGNEVARILEPVAKPMPLYSQKPQVVLVVGVNGSGKTTTIGKLASQFRSAGKSVVIAAGDTFRAAAVEQLQVWGERAGVPVLTAPEGSDPASLAFDAMNKCKNDNVDLLMIDTAGRLQNRKDLMEELDKIVRVIQKNDPSAPHNTLLVLDATTGQNAIRQVEVFQEVSKVTGLVMTKLDGTAKGGVLVALADKFGLPIHAIGVGEQIDDLQAFDPKDFAKALTGSDK